MTCSTYLGRSAASLTLAIVLGTASGCLSTGDQLRSGVEIESLGDSVSPGQDFHRYANDGWFGTVQLPPGRASLTVMNAVADDVSMILEQLIRDAVSRSEAGAASPSEERLAALYRSYVDMDARNRAGTRPIGDTIEAALNLESSEEVAAFMARPDSHSITHIGSFLAPDDPSEVVLWLDGSEGPGLLGLPDPALYFDQDDRSRTILAGYREYVRGTFVRAGVSDAEVRADAVVQLETRLAQGAWSPAQLRDRSANNFPLSTAELQAYAPGFPWRAFLEAGGVANATTLNLAQNTAVRHAAQVFSQTSLDDWRSFLAFHHIDDYWASLSKDFDDAGFEFKFRMVHGLDSRSGIEARAVQFVSATLREDLGRLFVESRFSTESRAELALLTDFIRRAMAEKFEQSHWMDDETKESALLKLDKMAIEVGYPRSPDTYEDLDVVADDLAGNRRRSLERNLRQSVARIGAPLPRDSWFMGAHVVDAGYSPQRNLVIFPAGMLQPPIFKKGVDPAANFGTIGVIMAHEIGHGFDDQGSQFDAFGRFAPWWSEQAQDEYEARTDKLVEQYCNYEVLPDVLLNCEQMRGEIIADMSGLEIAYRAYEMYVEEQQGGRAPVIDGLTGKERFFLAREQMARTVSTDAALERAARQSNHPPGEARSIIPLQNFGPWYKTFSIDEEDRLFLPPAGRVTLWGKH